MYTVHVVYVHKSEWKEVEGSSAPFSLPPLSIATPSLFHVDCGPWYDEVPGRAEAGHQQGGRVLHR